MTTTTPKSFDVLLNLIVILLAPVFLGVTGGDVALARMAALETVNDYRARNNADLLAVGQIVAFSLAAMGSLSLSMAADISPSMLLRFRGNGISCNRASEQNRRARFHYVSEPIPPEAEPLPTQPEPPPEPNVLTNDEVAQLLADEAQHRLDNPAERPSATPLAQIDPETTDARHYQERWAIVIAKESSDAHAAIPRLPPDERPAATIRAGKLSRAFHDLTYQGLLPPHELEAILSSVCPEFTGQQPPD